MTTFQKYLQLENKLQTLDDSDPQAEEIRDQLDDLWYQLTDDECRQLDERDNSYVLDQERR